MLCEALGPLTLSVHPLSQFPMAVSPSGLDPKDMWVLFIFVTRVQEKVGRVSRNLC